MPAVSPASETEARWPLCRNYFSGLREIYSLRFCNLILENEFRTNFNHILTKFWVKFVKIGNKINFSPYFSEFRATKNESGRQAEFDFSGPVRKIPGTWSPCRNGLLK